MPAPEAEVSDPPPVKKEEAAPKPEDAPPPKKEATTPAPAKESDPLESPHLKAEMADKPETKNGKPPTDKEIKSWEESKAAIKAFKEQVSSKDTELETLRAELSQVRNQAEQLAEGGEAATKATGLVTELQKELAGLKSELKIANYERSPEYKQQVLVPEQGIRDVIQKIAEANEADSGKLWNAVTETDPKKHRDIFNEVTDGLTHADIAELSDARTQYKQIARIKENIAGEAEAAWVKKQASEAHNKQQWSEADKQAHAKLAKATFIELQEKFPFLKTYEGAEAWNQSLATAEAKAANIDLDNLDVKERAEIVTSATIIPFLESALNSSKARIGTLTEQLAERDKQIKALSTASPNLGDRSGGEDTEDDPAPTASVGERIMSGVR